MTLSIEHFSRHPRKTVFAVKNTRNQWRLSALWVWAHLHSQRANLSYIFKEQTFTLWVCTHLHSKRTNLQTVGVYTSTFSKNKPSHCGCVHTYILREQTFKLWVCTHLHSQRTNLHTVGVYTPTFSKNKPSNCGCVHIYILKEQTFTLWVCTHLHSQRTNLQTVGVYTSTFSKSKPSHCGCVHTYILKEQTFTLWVCTHLHSQRANLHTVCRLIASEKAALHVLHLGYEYTHGHENQTLHSVHWGCKYTHSFIQTMGHYTPTTYGEGPFLHTNHGSLYTHNEWRGTIPPYKQWVTIHPQHMARDHSFIQTMGRCTPTVYIEGPFHHTNHGLLYTHNIRQGTIPSYKPWVAVHPWCMARNHSFIQTMGCCTPTAHSKGCCQFLLNCHGYNSFEIMGCNTPSMYCTQNCWWPVGKVKLLWWRKG